MSANTVRILVLASPRAHEVQQECLDIPLGSTVAEAMKLSALCRSWISENGTYGVAIWSRKVPLSRVLQEGDRLELCRPLRVDPKRARRERFNRQGSRGAGLFAKKRPGSKPGY
jgi:putative ubiquitin-RnfH superfamily antitoxin RatB of RatAB toxin-antitoxin module